MPRYVRGDLTDVRGWARLLVVCGLAVQVAARAEGSCGGGGEPGEAGHGAGALEQSAEMQQGGLIS